jgi:type IV pilus assembly protein PilO
MHPQITKIKKAYWDLLDNKLAKLKKEHKLAILAVSMIAPVVLFYFLLYSPNNTKIAKLKKDNTYLQGEIQKVEAIAGKLDEHEQERAAVELQLKAASLLLPKQKEIPSLLTNISEQGTNAGLEFVTFQPRPERNEKFYAVIPVAITVSGTYHKIGSFLDKISKLNRIVSVNNISLGGPRVTGGEVILTANLELITYRFLSSSEQTPVKATTTKRRR